MKKIKKVSMYLVAALMCVAFGSGAYLLLDHFNTPIQQEEVVPDAAKKDWTSASEGVTYLDGAGTQTDPWKISSAKEWAFLGNTMKILKAESVDDSAMAVAQALAGEDMQMVVASAKARSAGQIDANAFSLESKNPTSPFIPVGASALSDEQDSENLDNSHVSVVRANWETYASANYVNNFELVSDIDLSEYAWMPISSMTGNFNGNGHTINVGNRTFTSADFQDVSLRTADGGIGIGLFATASGEYKGIITKGAETIVQTSIVGIHIGGIVAEDLNGICIYDCINNIQITHVRDEFANVNKNYANRIDCYVGGIAGYFGNNHRGSQIIVSQCYNNGEISIEHPDVMNGVEYCIGGIVGKVLFGDTGKAQIYACSNFADIQFSTSSGNRNNLDKSLIFSGGILGQVESCQTSANAKTLVLGPVAVPPALEINSCANFGINYLSGIPLVGTDTKNYFRCFSGILGFYDCQNNNSIPILLIHCANYNLDAPGSNVNGRNAFNYQQIYGGVGDDALNSKLVICENCLYSQEDSEKSTQIFNKKDGSESVESGVKYAEQFDAKSDFIINVDFHKGTPTPMPLVRKVSVWTQINGQSICLDDDMLIMLGYSEQYVKSKVLKEGMTITVDGEDYVLKTLPDSARFENYENFVKQPSYIPLDNNGFLFHYLCPYADEPRTFLQDKLSGPMAQTPLYNEHPRLILEFEKKKTCIQPTLQYYKTEGGSTWRFEDVAPEVVCGGSNGVLIRHNNSGFLDADDIEQGQRICVGDTLQFQITPSVGYAVVGVFGFVGDPYIDPKTGKMEMGTLAFGTSGGNLIATYRVPHLILLSNYDSARGGVNKLTTFGHVTGNSVTLTAEQLPYLKSIYVCFKEVTYEVNVQFYSSLVDEQEKTFYLQMTPDVLVKYGCYSVNSLDLLPVDWRKVNGSVVHATVWSEDGLTQYSPSAGDGILKRFESVSQSVYNTLAASLGSATVSEIFSVDYEDLIGSDKFIRNSAVSSCLIRLRVGQNDSPTLNVTTYDYCNLWYGTNTWSQSNYGGMSTVNNNQVASSTRFTVTATPDSSFSIFFRMDPEFDYNAASIARKYGGQTLYSTIQTFNSSQVVTASWSEMVEDFYVKIAGNRTLAPYFLNAIKNANGMYNAAKELSGTPADEFAKETSVSYQCFYSLAKYPFEGELHGAGSVAMKTFENQNYPSATGKDKTFVGKQTIYFNAPVVLKATANVGSRFTGWYLATESGEKLLSTDEEYHFVWDGDAVEEQMENGQLDSTSLKIVARFTSLDAGEAPSYVGGQYLISKPEHLVWLSHAVATNQMSSDGRPVSEHMFRLVNDIDMSQTSVGQDLIFNSIGTAEHPFRGLFDGNFKTIKNLTTFANSSDVSALMAGRGLFGYTQNALIKNLSLNATRVAGLSDVGAVAGHAVASEFSRVEILDEAIEATKIGVVDVLGRDRATEIDRLEFEDTEHVAIDAQHKAKFEAEKLALVGTACENFGGLIGYAEECKIIGCSSRRGTMYAADDGSYVAGLVGRATGKGNGTIIDQCFSMVEVNKSTENHVNMLANIDVDSQISDCYYGSIENVSYSDKFSEMARSEEAAVLNPTEQTLEDDSTIWGVLNRKLVLKKFYWL